jgi:hypothetical protein
LWAVSLNETFETFIYFWNIIIICDNNGEVVLYWGRYGMRSKKKKEVVENVKRMFGDS